VTASIEEYSKMRIWTMLGTERVSEALGRPQQRGVGREKLDDDALWTERLSGREDRNAGKNKTCKLSAICRRPESLKNRNTSLEIRRKYFEHI